MKPVIISSSLLGILFFGSPALGQRLPQSVTPSHYDITVAPDLAAAKFRGEVRIRVQLQQPSQSITMNAAEIEFHDVTVTAGGRTQKATVALDEKNEQVTFSVPVSIPAGAAELHIRYTGILNDDLRGLYLSQANNRRYAITQLEATDARRMFPSFDEPAFKATFALSAIIDAADRAISNGAIVSDTPGPAGKHTIKFETTPKMSTYLVALAVGDFECNEGAVDGIPVRICSTPDKKHLTGFALESARQILQYFNRYYSIRYPFKKLDVVAVPDFAAGAMENTAAIFYREALLLADKDASVGTRKSIAGVLAHEIAHQWFGNIVTMAWWDDIWLNEGFANWAQSKPVKAWKPEWHVDLDEVRGNHGAMSLDSLRSTRPVRVSASTPAEITELFDAIAYEKGAAVVRMIESWIGEEPFRKAVNAYIERFQYSNARAEDFWNTLAASTGKPVDKVMAAFVDQPGVPLVEVDLSCKGSSGTVALTQRRYVVSDASDSAMTSAVSPAPGPGQTPLWRIPVCVRLPDGKITCDLLDERTETIPVGSCPAWVMANAGARGYYHTAPTPAMIRTIAANVPALPAAERMALLSDEWALVRAGIHDVGSYLDLASGFKAERSARVMQTLVSRLANIGADLTTAETRRSFSEWMSALLSPALDEIGWIPKPGEPDDTRALRASIVRALGVTAREPKVLAKARELVEQELEKPGTIDATLLNIVVELAALEGDAALYDKYLARSRAATDPEQRYLYLYALASFGDPALVRRTLELAIGPEVRSQDTKLVLAEMLAAQASRELAWDLIRERWGAIQAKTGEFVGNTIIVSTLGMFCDPAAIDEVKAFFATHKVPDAERTLQQSLERISSCARLAAAQRGKLAEWLRTNQGRTGFAAASPATVVHSRTCQRCTRPFTT
jgi:puromycin-sensitive aminopeptidase